MLVSMTPLPLSHTTHILIFHAQNDTVQVEGLLNVSKIASDDIYVLYSFTNIFYMEEVGLPLT